MTWNEIRIDLRAPASAHAMTEILFLAVLVCVRKENMITIIPRIMDASGKPGISLFLTSKEDISLTELV